MFTTNPISLKDLLDDMESGEIQLPDFQRGWVWDDERIKSLLVSISRGFPIGAIMTLSADGEIQFHKRPIEGVELDGTEKHERYLLDGQQRLTSLYQALRHKKAVETRDRPGGRKVINRWYYIDMKKSLDPYAEPEDAFISMPEDKIERRNFGRDIVRDLSSQEMEFQQHMIPTEQVMDPTEWIFSYVDYWKETDPDAFSFANNFRQKVLTQFADYDLPVINLDKDTSKEAVCTVFEKVNTGGVTLNVFELLTASFAAEGYRLRDDWEKRRERMHSRYGVLQGVDNTHFLQSVTLLATQEYRRQAIEEGHPAPPGIGCKRDDILNLTLEDYRKWADKAESGFESAAKFLHSNFVFTENNLPYNTQLVPLSAIFVELGQELEPANAETRLERWYWSGVFGEMYGSAVESQYARDLAEVPKYIRNGSEPTLIGEANFAPARLISLRTRQSAAYKGLYAMQMKNGGADWRTSKSLTLSDWHDDRIDIHHIFPKKWCESVSNPAVPPHLFNSIINKTPIDARTNKIIGGNAPSVYLPRLRNHNDKLHDVLESHWLNPDMLEADKFVECFVERGEAMLDLIGTAMGHTLESGRETFLSALQTAGLAVDFAEVVGHVELESEIFDEDEDEFDYLGEAAFDDVQVAAADG